jgi:hypothetical protein
MPAKAGIHVFMNRYRPSSCRQSKQPLLKKRHQNFRSFRPRRAAAIVSKAAPPCPAAQTSNIVGTII